MVDCQFEEAVIVKIKVIKVFETVFSKNFFYLFLNPWIILTTESAVHVVIELVLRHDCEALDELISEEVVQFSIF
jgi:hypothetical protein